MDIENKWNAYSTSFKNYRIKYITSSIETVEQLNESVESVYSGKQIETTTGFAVEFEQRDERSREPELAMVYGINQHYFFELKKTSKGYALLQCYSKNDPAGSSLLAKINRIREGNKVSPLAGTCQPIEQHIEKLHIDQSGTLLSLAEFEFKPGVRCKSLKAILDKSDYTLPTFVDIRLESKNMETSVIQKNVYKSIGRLPVRVMRLEEINTKIGQYTTTSKTTTVSEYTMPINPDSEELFLTYYGLPEPVEVNRLTTRDSYSIIAIFSIGLLLTIIAIMLRYIHKKG